jgi:hypothetical protein
MKGMNRFNHHREQTDMKRHCKSKRKKANIFDIRVCLARIKNKTQESDPHDDNEDRIEQSK